MPIININLIYLLRLDYNNEKRSEKDRYKYWRTSQVLSFVLIYNMIIERDDDDDDDATTYKHR